MAAIGSSELVVDQSAIDANGHVNNVHYIQWMQDAAMAHSASLGWPYERYVEYGATWIIRSHSIEYLHSSYAGDTLIVYTWVNQIKKFRSLRKFKFYRPADDTVIARAETLFIFCDIASGRPRSIPPEVQQVYKMVSEEDEP
ncbi:thioesterase family protein [Desulfogranum marinum]|jgi:acyl-CoA thioester hydrolase|uniref:acyl-CoA thioesterase n=1 Tax=Desulfogranum marinum TaxID=453220 RepID=UPI00196245DC|nr:thioesterase family protein [Desulfogranum marinum]MBM9514425.1 acyl-CoA thioesterase [Desulfogranum marinum]